MLKVLLTSGLMRSSVAHRVPCHHPHGETSICLLAGPTSSGTFRVSLQQNAGTPSHHHGQPGTGPGLACSTQDSFAHSGKPGPQLLQLPLTVLKVQRDQALVLLVASKSESGTLCGGPLLPPSPLQIDLHVLHSRQHPPQLSLQRDKLLILLI